MSKQGQSKTAQQENQNQQVNKPDHSIEQMGKQPAQVELASSLMGSSDNSTLQAQAARLSDTRFNAVQRQMMASQLGQVGGNQHLSKVMTHMKQNTRYINPSFVQRQEGGQISTQLGGGSYKVIGGDTLWKISKNIYGDGLYWTEIYNGNSDKVGDGGNALAIGTILTLPVIDVPVASTQNTPANSQQDTRCSSNESSGNQSQSSNNESEGNEIASQQAQTPLEARLDRIEQNYRAMITDARGRGYNVAADNLQRFLDGTGGTRRDYNIDWLRSFDVVTSAESVNQGRFEETLTKIAYELNDGETRTLNEYWDRMITGSVFTELFYASGTSTVTSTGHFTLTRNGKVITITGPVEHRWWDPYDWHAGLGALIPGHGTISDEDALLLQQHRGAGPFDMEAKWTQTVAGEIKIVNLWFDSENYEWSGP